MPDPELERERDLTNLRDYYLAGSDEEEIPIPDEQRRRVPPEHAQHRYQKDAGPLGKAEFLRGDVVEGPEQGKRYETWTLPGELNVELPELGSVRLTKVRTGFNRESDAKGNVESRWGDGEFTGLDLGPLDYQALGWKAAPEKKNTEQADLGHGRVVFRERTNPDEQDAEPTYHYHETRSFDPSSTVIATVELPSMGGAVGQERSLVATTFRLKRVEASRDAAAGVQGRAKFVVSIEQAGEPAAG